MFVKDDFKTHFGLLEVETLQLCKAGVKFGLYLCSMNVLPD